MSAYHIGQVWEVMAPFSDWDRAIPMRYRFEVGDKFIIKKVIINQFGRFAVVLRPNNQSVSISDHNLITNCWMIPDPEE